MSLRKILLDLFLGSEEQELAERDIRLNDTIQVKSGFYKGMSGTAIKTRINQDSLDEEIFVCLENGDEKWLLKNSISKVIPKDINEIDLTKTYH